MAGASEHSIASCYSVVYDFDNGNQTWKVAGNGGWSELHLCQDDSDQPPTYRLLAWTHENQEVLVNVNLNFKCEYKEKSENFHSFKDEDKRRRGFGFHKSVKNLQSARDFFQTVQETITDLRRREHTANPTQQRNASIATVPTISSDARSKPPERQPDGSLKIHRPQETKEKFSDSSITNPDTVKHQGHVTFDQNTGQWVFDNESHLPKGFKKLASQAFGVPPKNLPRADVPGYEEHIPLLLIQLKGKIKDLGGLQEKGIFRLAPDAAECARIKNMINSGEEWNKERTDVNVFANLLKVWFRDLPKPLLNIVKPEVIERNQTMEGVRKAMEQFPPLEKSLLMWLWDFCVEISNQSDTNKMTVTNLGIVIGPNLFNTTSFDNPMKAMDFSGKVVTFFQKGIEWRKSLQ